MDVPTPEQQEAWELAQIHQRRSRLHAKPIGSVVRRLMASAGYGQTQAAEQLKATWSAAVGLQLASLSRPGAVSRGSLLVMVENSAVMQEIHFRKKAILAALQDPSAGLPKIRDLKIRIGPIDSTPG